MIIKRSIKMPLEKSFSEKGEVTLLFGPRQAGKTTVLREIIAEIGSGKAEYFSGDDVFVQEAFGKNNLEALRRAVSGKDIIVIDEAQRIANIGLSAKLIVDELPVKVVLSGSSSFELSNKVSEPLTGRTKTFHMHPLSWAEVAEKYKKTLPADALEELLRFGMYPKVQTLESDERKETYLSEYLGNYLSKDILMFGQVRKPKKVFDLLTLLALQVGSEVSIAELSRNLALSQQTVERYLDILEKMFIIIQVRGFSRNLRKEISKTSKYYFSDVGVRNAVIRNFNPMRLRGDVGALFENWFIVERMKRADNALQPKNYYFWRTYDQQEIDLIEEQGGVLTGYECKYSSRKGSAPPRAFTEAYPDSKFVPISGVDAFRLLEEIEESL
ncbi:MAG: ATP-binding protein [Candidatus Moraniibacteriota bacterium]